MKFTKTQFCFAWICFWIFFGLLLDSFMGMKQLFYLANPIRREMWRLAHTHGTLMTLVFLAYVHFRGISKKQHENMMFIGALLMPVGFFLGGIVTTEIDPFVGVFLVMPDNYPGAPRKQASDGTLTPRMVRSGESSGYPREVYSDPAKSTTLTVGPGEAQGCISEGDPYRADGITSFPMKPTPPRTA